MRRFPLDKLERDEVEFLILAAEEDACDVLVIELGGGPGFLVKAFDVFLILGQVGRQDLQRDKAIQLGVAGTQDGGHAAGAICSKQLEMSQPPAADVAGGRLGCRGRSVLG